MGSNAWSWYPPMNWPFKPKMYFRVLGKHTRVKAFAIHGGVDQDPQIKQLDKGVDVLIATPGRMFDLVSQGALQAATGGDPGTG